MPRGKRVIKSGTYRTRKRAMRSRRLRRESVFWVLAAAFAAVVVWGLFQLGSTGWRDAASWLKARRVAAERASHTQPVTVALIGVDAAKAPKVAIGLGVVQLVPSERRVRGIYFSGDTFVEVPGQGFERAADALSGGPSTALATVANALGIKLDHYVVLDLTDYKALTEKGVANVLLSRAVLTDIPADQRTWMAQLASEVPTGEALMVPMPVKTVSVGEDIYYQPQKDKIADVLKSWWGISASPQQQPLRIKILNGSGLPGIAGVAAKVLIRDGYQVIDTTNASAFTVGRTRIVVYHATDAAALQIQKVIGNGRIVRGKEAQDVVDVIIVIGKDFKPPKV